MSSSRPLVAAGSLLVVAGLLSLSLAACGDGETGAIGSQVGTLDGGVDPTGGEPGAVTSGAGTTTGTGTTPTSAGAGGAGGSELPYEPDPIPELDEEPAPLCPDAPSGYFQFLDDSCNSKRFPSSQDRDRACPSVDESAVVALPGGGEAVYRPSSEPVVVEDVLGDLLPAGMNATVILIRRVGGVPHYRYLSNGTAHVAYQPWSTTKWLAAANAAANLQIQSSYTVGLSASVGGRPLGDLVTSIHNYDYDPYSSNALGRYFHDIGGRARANALIHGAWLGRPASETFGGNYGAAAPALGYTFVQGGASVSITPDSSTGPANHLSSFTMAEALKRVVLHREEPEQRLPGLQWADIKTLLYGAEGSAKYGDWGGMTQDTAVYLQSAHDIDYIEARSHGQWAVFSKLGLGSQGQFLDVGYACLPVLDDEAEPVAGWGREVVIAAHLPTGGASWAARDRLLARAYRALMIRIVDGRL